MKTPITAQDIRIAAAIATMFAALRVVAGLARNHGDRCKWTCSEPFQYAIGCTNRPIATRRTVGHFGQPTTVQACAACLALHVAGELQPRGRQALLNDILASAGITNYRTWRAPAEWKASRRAPARSRRRAA